MKLITEIGHTQKRPGAIGYDGVTEYERNKYLAERMALWMNYFEHNTDIMEGSTMDAKKIDTGLSNSIDKLNSKPKGSRFFSIHFNPDTRYATGTEMFVSKYTSRQNKRKASWVGYHISNLLEIPLRRAVSSRTYKFSHEAHVGRLAILDDTIIEGMLTEIAFQNATDLKNYEGKQDQVAYILTLGLIHDFKDNNEPQYNLIKQYHKLASIKPKL